MDLCENSEKYSFSKYPWYALRADYAGAISKMGAVPFMIPYDANAIDDVLDVADGILIPGGDVDVHPSKYNEEVKSNTLNLNSERTDYDFKLLDKVFERNMPLLGICYGMQLLNVYLGGSLIQHIHDHDPNLIQHMRDDLKDKPAHGLEIEPGSKLADIANGKLSWEVNSTHHQAAKEVGPDVRISARASDGVIEAIESPKYNFALGVEWHPEYLMNDLDEAIFKAFLDASRSKTT